MCRRSLLFPIFFSLVWMALTPQDAYLDADQIWERGKKAAKQGDYTRALKIWETARTDTVKGKYSSDPRIGFDYIALATEQNMVK